MSEPLSSILSPYLTAVLVSTGIGFIVGLEREFRLVSEKDHYAGLRTFPLVAVLGCLVAYTSHSLHPMLAVSTSFAFFLFMIITYFIRSRSGHAGITSQISLVITFILGMMTAFDLIKEALAAAVLTTTILSLKDKFRSFASRITEDELFAFIKFAIMSMLVLPFLPDKDYGPSGILNPMEIGTVIVIVSSISFASYILTKLRGQNQGILITSFLGGLFSSTAVTWLFSARSRQAADSHQVLYSAGIILASSIMFLRVTLLTLIFNRNVFNELVIPCGVMALVGFAIAFALARKGQNQSNNETVQLGNPVDILNALGFGILYTTIVLMVFYANSFFGKSGLIWSGFISGLADVDAISIAMSKLADTTDASLPVMVIVIAMISNTIVKMIIALSKGAQRLRVNVTGGLLAIVAAGVIYLLLRGI